MNHHGNGETLRSAIRLETHKHTHTHSHTLGLFQKPKLQSFKDPARLCPERRLIADSINQLTATELAGI